MATLAQRRPENVAGDVFVDRTCIDCDTCRWMAPTVFHRVGDRSAVIRQPASHIERRQALQALLACPTASIGTVEKPSDIRQIQQSFPIPITDDVFHCGYHSELSYGAASYVIQRQDGNVLVDSPRFTPPLVKQLETLGGIRYLYLTHRDDVADHRKFCQHFECERILHVDDVTSDTQDVEIQLEGADPFALSDDCTIVPVPGHTKGHTVLLYNSSVLFTGDHLAWSPRVGHLAAFHRFCWYSWPEQIRSMQRVADYSFEWVLPGHGRRFHADQATMRLEMQACVEWMQSQ